MSPFLLITGSQIPGFPFTEPLFSKRNVTAFSARTGMEFPTVAKP
jgi:hypothetical protein